MYNSRKIFIIIITLTALSLAPLFADGQQEEASSGEAATSEVMLDEMQVSVEVQGDNLLVEVSAPTTGWVAVGFKATRMMKDANIIMGYVDGGEVFLEDHFGVSNFGHKPDVELGGGRNVTLRGGSEDGTTTELAFLIPLAAADEYDVDLSPGETVKMICAYGATDDTGKKHRYRKSTQILIQ
jgi:hypothetical protein